MRLDHLLSKEKRSAYAPSKESKPTSTKEKPKESKAFLFRVQRSGLVDWPRGAGGMTEKGSQTRKVSVNFQISGRNVNVVMLSSFECPKGYSMNLEN